MQTIRNKIYRLFKEEEPEISLKDLSAAEWKESYRLLIPSIPELTEKVIEYFMAKISAVSEISINLYGIRMALSEALSNAMEHGNQFNPAKKIKIILSVDPAKIRITITDEGKGFDFKAEREDLRALNKRFSTRGRGIFIMKTFMDKTWYVSPGNTLVMIKYFKNR